MVETWLTEAIFDCEIDIVNYKFIRRDRINEFKSKGGGIVIYFRQDLPVVDLTTDYSSNIDHLWVRVLLQNCKPISVGIFYKPPDSNEDQVRFLKESISKYKTVNTIIMGDFNYGDIN